MDNNPVVLVERTKIFPCQTCSRAFLRQNDLDKHVARLNHVNREIEFKPLILRPLSGCDNESTDFVLRNLIRGRDAEIHKRTNITKNKEKKSLLLRTCTSSENDYNSKKTSDNAFKSETKRKKKKQTKEGDSKELIVKIDTEQKVAARLNTDHSNSTKADIVSIIPNDSIKQESKEDNNKIHSIKDSDAKLTCGQCSKSFKTLAGITKHLQNHFKPTYQCSQCPKSFLTAQKLSKHVSRQHTHDTLNKRMQCNICHKELKNSTTLNIHLRTHTGERPFACKQCGKKFTQAAALYTHNKIHLGIKEHICTYCNKAFLVYHNMKLHEITHTNERPYECKYCNKAFSDPSALRRHIRTHTGSKIYQCPLCPMKFSDASGLIAHKRRHTGKKDFDCKYCVKQFFTRSEALNHETAVHMKIKNYECELCKKRFALKHYLKIHIVNCGH